MEWGNTYGLQRAMVISLDDALAILNKWKDESANILVAAESPFRQTLRGIDGQGVRWAMRQQVKVSQIMFSAESRPVRRAIVDFEGPAGNLSLLLYDCFIIYGDPREATPEAREEAEATTVSALCIFLPSEEGFHFYELRNATWFRGSVNLAKSDKNRVRKLLALWHEGKISGLEYSRRATKLAKTKPKVNKKLKKRLAKIDRKYNPRPKKMVSGGLPELGKRR
jgi:hypothetical protein